VEREVLDRRRLHRQPDGSCGAAFVVIKKKKRKVTDTLLAAAFVETIKL